MTTTFYLKFKPHGNEAEQLVNQAIDHLDLRKKHLQNDERNRRIVSSILAQRLGPFVVSMSAIDKADREAVRAVLEGFVGPILTRVKGRSTYALREEYRDPSAKFSTAKDTSLKGRQSPSVTTAFGTIYEDGSHSEVPFEHIKFVGFAKPSLVRIVAPHKHWEIFLGDTPPPSVNWRELTESDTEHPDHDQLMDFVLEQAFMNGAPMVRYGSDAFITGTPDPAIFAIDNSISRYSGRASQRPLIEIIDSYKSQHIRWGGK